MTDEELLARCFLEMSLSAGRHFDVWDEDAIAQFRRVGRLAVRQLGHRAATSQSDPVTREDGRVVVVVLADADSEHADRERLGERGAGILRTLSTFD